MLKLSESLPRSTTGSVLAKQLLRAGTSVGANYRAACRARSQAEFVAKLGTVEVELDEVMYWMEMIVEAGLAPQSKLTALMDEADQLLGIIVSSTRTVRSNKSNKRSTR